MPQKPGMLENLQRSDALIGVVGAHLYKYQTKTQHAGMVAFLNINVFVIYMYF